MAVFHARLRRFKSNWLAVGSDAAAAGRDIACFRFFADDTPRFAGAGVAAFWPPDPPVALPTDFPRFAKAAGREGRRLAA